MILDEKTFTEVLKANKGILYKVANSYSKNIDDRNDILQEISFQLWKSWSRYNNEFKISTWIYRISLNVAISYYRKKYTKREANMPLQENIVFVDNSEEVELNENIKELYHIISQFSELNKALILLYLEKYSYEEIADTLGISTTNVATKISRIKKELKKKFNTK